MSLPLFGVFWPKFPLSNAESNVEIWLIGVHVGWQQLSECWWSEEWLGSFKSRCSESHWWRIYIESWKVDVWLGSAEDGFGEATFQTWCQTGFASNWAPRCRGCSRIEAGWDFAAARYCGRKSHLKLYICANEFAGCLAFLHWEHVWGEAFIRRSDTRDTPTSLWKWMSFPPAKRPWKLDIWCLVQPQPQRCGLS